MSGNTKTGMIIPRVPAGDARHRLYELALRGADHFPRWRFGAGALLAETCAAALLSLTITESQLAEARRSLAAAQLKNEQLREENERLSALAEWRHREPTRPSVTGIQTELVARTATRTGVLAVPEGRR